MLCSCGKALCCALSVTCVGKSTATRGKSRQPAPHRPLAEQSWWRERHLQVAFPMPVPAGRNDLPSFVVAVVAVPFRSGPG